MPTQDILEWLADQGLTEVHTSDEVANPTDTDAVLFQHTAAAAILTLRFTFVNDCPVATTYAVQKDSGEGFVDVLRPIAHPHLLEPVSLIVELDVGEKIRAGIVANPEASGTSRVVVEFIAPNTEA